MTKKPRLQRLALLALATIITGLSILYLDSGRIIGAMAGAYLLAASAYSALDIGAMVRTTATLPTGQYKRVNAWKYWVTMFFTGALLALAFFRQRTTGINLELAIGFLGPGIIGIIGIMIGGVKANKIATWTSPTQGVLRGGESGTQPKEGKNVSANH